MQGDIVGRMKETWRYPVRSLSGEFLSQTDVEARGVAGDRGYCIVDPENAMSLSASQGKRKWRPLVASSARLLDAAEGLVVIKLANGRELLRNAPDVEQEFSAAWGASIRLAHNKDAIGDGPCIC